MTSHEPEDGTRPGDEDPAETSPAGPARRAQLPADVDAAFAAIVAEWVAADAPHWPGGDGTTDPTRGGTSEGTDATTGLSSGVGLATPPDGTPGPGPVAPGPGPYPPTAGPPRDRGGTDHPGGTWRAPTGPGPDRDDPEDHYVPPEPPPLPRVGLSSLAGLLLIVVGVVLLAVPGLIGGAIGLGIVPGLVAMTAGLGWLVVGMRRPSERDGSGPDDAGEV